MRIFLLTASVFTFIFPISALAQVQTPDMFCLDINTGAILPMHFRENHVFFKFNSSTYNLSYSCGYVDKDGIRWSAYENNEVEVLTSIPYDRYVYLGTKGFGGEHARLAAANCIPNVAKRARKRKHN